MVREARILVSDIKFEAMLPSSVEWVMVGHPQSPFLP